MEDRGAPHDESRGGAIGHTPTAASDTTTVTDPAWAVPLTWLGLPVACGLIGWFLHVAAGWWSTSDWGPLRGPARLIDAIPEPYGLYGLIALGVVVGLVLAGIAQYERCVVHVSRERVEVRRKGQTHTVTGTDVGGVFRDRKELVLLGTDTAELARVPCDLNDGRLARAFLAHGYRWRDRDPHADEFRVWVPETKGLPEGANALLTARRSALGSDAKEADELRGELARLGVVVRDEGKRQHWRLLASPEADT